MNKISNRLLLFTCPPAVAAITPIQDKFPKDIAGTMQIQGIYLDTQTT
ncbi:hypothetical protein [Mucilaginibacter corticis]|nr:hypothetical protein [Mucilaginibacter corticis]